MANMPLRTFMNAFLLLPVALAMPWIEATPTPTAGIPAMMGMSPRPTEAPMVGKIPKELLRRAPIYTFPPPPNWCGFVTKDYNHALKCPESSQSCFVGNNGGFNCCDNISTCKFFNTCYDSTTACATCNTNTILHCSSIERPFCGSYAFFGGNYYYCDSTTQAETLATRVEYLNDFYSTAIGSTIGSDGFATAVPFSTTLDSSGVSSTTDRQSTTPASVSSQSSKTAQTAAQTAAQTTTGTAAPTAAPHKGLAVGAIAGIAVGAGCIALAAIAGIILCCCMRKRRRNHAADAQTQPPPQATFAHNPPMQQTVPDPAYPNATQNVQYPPQYQGSPPTSTYASTYNGHPSPINSPLLAHDPNNRMSNISPPPLPYNHSATTNSPLLPNASIMNDAKMNTPAYLQPTHSPAPMDASGMGATMGYAATNEKDQLHEVSGVPMHVQGQNNAQTQGHSQDIAHEVSTQSEPRYTAYNPTIENQHESSYTTYSQSSGQDLSGNQSYTNTQTSSHDPLKGQQSSPGIWELPEQREAH